MTLRFTLPALAVAHQQAVLDAAAPIHPQAIAAAAIRNAQHSPSHITGRWRSKLYNETPERARWRTLLDAAAQVPGAVCAITFLKDSGEARTMVCLPLGVEAEYTKRYALVYDIDAGGHRRVNLDAIIKMTIETHALES